MLSFGAYSLSSVVARDGMTSADTLSDSSALTFDGSGTSSYTLTTSDAGNVSFGLRQSNATGGATEQVSSSYTLSIRATDSVTQADSATASDYQAGVYSGGSYALSSVVSDAAGTSVYDETSAGTVLSDASESFSVTSSDGSNDTLALGPGNSSGTTGQDSFAWSGHDHANTTLIYSDTAHSFDSFAYHEAGSYANGSYSFGSVLYQGGGSSSLTDHTQENDESDGSGLLTMSSGGTVSSAGSFTGGTTAGSGLSSGSGAYSYSYGDLSSTTVNDAGTGSYADYQAGQWSNGSYSLSSLTHAEAGSAAETISLSDVQTNSQTLVGSSTDSGNSTLANGTGFGIDGSSTNAQTGTFNYAGTDTMTLNSAASSSYSLYESGTLSGQCLSLGSILCGPRPGGAAAGGPPPSTRPPPSPATPPPDPFAAASARPWPSAALPQAEQTRPRHSPPSRRGGRTARRFSGAGRTAARGDSISVRAARASSRGRLYRHCRAAALLRPQSQTC